ncbi:hypothetical protein P168DRAFT_285704 [Aspergillus campestris IBT 28561]|uniref:Uncharacterized protein n=1 Tax=Aspergillus campestris (strain IBT 28561) TaxID=1392248 RepID=A0A2I1CRG1_ASPC2|nr:uncharacterized protein P168DRAFT_285704 [Aspergillus campestris IBT 28561]PKY00197.1 hypothetical protein P168DRAFT_285704 [Aspergillus campestris IBT 28561]
MPDATDTVISRTSSKIIPELLEISSCGSVDTQSKPNAPRIETCPNNDRKPFLSNSQDTVYSTLDSKTPVQHTGKSQSKSTYPATDKHEEQRNSVPNEDQPQIGSRARTLHPVIINNPMEFRTSEPSPQLMESAKQSPRKEQSNASHIEYSLNAQTAGRHCDRKQSFCVSGLPETSSSCITDSGDSGFLVPTPSHSLGHPAHDRTRHDCRQFSGCPISLAASSADSHINGQTLAAFPHEQVYQAVDDFAIGKEGGLPDNDSDCRLVKPAWSSEYRHASSADLQWEIDDLRPHEEEAQTRERVMTGTKGSRLVPATAESTEADRASAPNIDQRSCETTEVKHIIIPPMLGNDLVFPRSVSPESTLYESNRPPRGGHLSRVKSSNDCGLWCMDSCPKDSSADKGLWMGTCKAEQQKHDLHDSFLPGCLSHHDVAKGSWSLSDEDSSTRDESRHPASGPGEAEVVDDVERGLNWHEGPNYECNDEFVTQIYNYLSLGYPCVARYYDHELGEVSGICLAELRQDDLNTDANGYVGVAQSTPDDTEPGTRACIRWIALRLYINEWARQQSRMANNSNNRGTWGVQERRESLML